MFLSAYQPRKKCGTNHEEKDSSANALQFTQVFSRLINNSADKRGVVNSIKRTSFKEYLICEM